MQSLKQERQELLNRIEAIAEKAKMEEREFTAAEKATMESCFARIAGINETLNLHAKADEMAAENYRTLKASNDAKAKILAGSNIGGDGHAPIRTTWTNADGEPVRALYKGDRWHNPTQSQEQFSLGNVVRAVATGKRKFAAYEFKNAMTESS